MQSKSSPESELHFEILRLMGQFRLRLKNAGPEDKRAIAWFMLKQATMACAHVARAFRDDPKLFPYHYFPVMRSLRKKEDGEADKRWLTFRNQYSWPELVKGVAQDEFYDRLM